MRSMRPGNRIVIGGSTGTLIARTGLPAPISSATYDPLTDRLLTWNGAGPYQYDLNGNLTSDGTNTYEWSKRNLLKDIKQGMTTTAVFTYDGVGRRKSKTVGSATTQFLYDGLNPIQELSAAGAATANLLTGLGVDQYFARTLVSGGVRRSFAHDALGSTLALLDDSGAAQTQYVYEPYGAMSLVAPSSDTNAFQFTGRENDGTGLFAYRARYYAPSWGRFISEDPLMGGGYPAGSVLALINPQGLNGYVYGFDSPVNYTDPTGENPAQTAADMWREYRRMRRANTIGADKYFHCLASCQGARDGFLSRSTAELIGEGREWFDQYIKGDPGSACDEDRAANWQGLLGDRSSPCRNVCANLRPPALQPGY